MFWIRDNQCNPRSNFLRLGDFMKIIDCDYLVVGSGIAGLMSGLKLSAHGSVVIATKKQRADSNTNRAQGGIAAVMASDDSFAEHVADTLDAGAGLCDESVVRQIVSGGPARIEELESFGLRFAGRPDHSGKNYDLGREGGHSKRRVLHTGDVTGKSVEEVLLGQVQDNPKIELHEHWMLIDLITTGWLGEPGENRCVGAYFLDAATGKIFAIRAPYVVLATGGGGKVYLYTTNPDIATGDGIAVAWRAGVPMKDLEFIQFHPTCLYHPDCKNFLISEAVRGEGAIIVDKDGKPFMDRYDKRESLAPRDIVARAIDREMKESGSPCVYLDIRHQPRQFLMDRFPSIFDTCLRYGIDMSRDLIPVVPAAHYLCGGIEAAVDGSTALPGLYACGEVACTGLHGANRLASNSLLEALVCSHEMAATIGTLPPASDFPRARIPAWTAGNAVHSDEAVVVEHNWNEVRTCMWDYVGIVRSDKRLERAWRRIQNIQDEIREYYLSYLVTPDILELRNIAVLADLIIRSARQRKESRGLHFNMDHPNLLAVAEDTIIRRQELQPSAL